MGIAEATAPTNALQRSLSRIGRLSDCTVCLDTGFWLTPKGKVWDCPNVMLGKPHVAENKAGQIVRRSAERLLLLGEEIISQEFQLAQMLTRVDGEEPCPRSIPIRFFYGDTNLTSAHSLRKLHSMIENLRKKWLLPIGGRKAEPSGYWVITELEEYKQWYRSVTSAPITQLSTIHKNAKHNFPHFAEQMELEFWRDLEPEAND